MKVSKAEQSNLKIAIAIGELIGYGNLISHLASAWAAHLVREGMDEKTALEHAGGRSGLPLAMHEDIINNGEWDETGERYRTKSKRQ